MSQKTKKEVLEKLRHCYAKAGPVYRRKLIDQAVELMGYHRKSAIRALAAKPAMALGVPGIIGRSRLYEPGLLLPALKTMADRPAAVWETSGNDDARMGSRL